MALQVASIGGHLQSTVRAAARGDEAAFKKLYVQYGPSVYNLVLRSMRNQQVAEDVCQEVWVKAYRELHRLAEPQAFPAWLYRIAARACVDAARKNSRAPMTVELPEDRPPLADDEPEKSAIQRERVRLTWEALAVLPARQHLALFLREMERRSYKEIAQMLETSEPAVETLLFRARRGFAKAYERLEATMRDRCQHAELAMAAIMDGEATQVQQTAVRAHVDACRSCSGDLIRMQRAAAAYSALGVLPVPALLCERIFASLGVTGARAAPIGIAKFLAVASAKAKVCALTLVATTVTTAVTVATLASPIRDEIRPSPAVEPRADRVVESGAGPSEVRADARGSAESAIQNDSALTAPALDETGPVSEATGNLNDLTSSALMTVNETATELTGTVDTIVHETEALANDVLPAGDVETEVVAPPAVAQATPAAVPGRPALP